MNAHATEVLNNIRKTLQTELEGTNVQNAPLSEDEQKFVSEGLAFAKKAGYELEGMDEATPEEVREMLQSIGEDEGGEVTEQVNALLGKYWEEEV